MIFPPSSRSSLANNELVLPYACDLQIIVPVYNVEGYLRELHGLHLILNAKRIRNMPEEIRQSVFILSRNLLDKHRKDSVVPKRYACFYHLIQRNDFGAYNLYKRIE